MAKILENETADDMLNAIVVLTADMIPDYGTVIRTDNAPQFQRLNSLSNDQNSWLSKFNIKIELGATFNKNRNPIAENLVKECHKEIESITDLQKSMYEMFFHGSGCFVMKNLYDPSLMEEFN